MSELFNPGNVGDPGTLDPKYDTQREALGDTDSRNDKRTRRNMRDLETAADEIEKGPSPDGPDAEFGA